MVKWVLFFKAAEVFMFGAQYQICWALSDQKGMSYLAKKKSLTKRAYTYIINSTKKRKAALLERLFAQLCSVYARFICGGNVFCNPL